MLLTSIVVASLIISLAIVQLGLAIYFYWIVKRGAKPTQLDAKDQVLASVVVSVRGCDPSLRTSLAALLDQDYRQYDVHVVVDSRSDCAWNVVQEIKENSDPNFRLTVHEMRTPAKTCGLKCNALVQALENLDPKTRYLVLMDADVTPHKTWLQEVTAPLLDKEIGVVTGNQWFEPKHNASVGSWIRSIWNAGAIVPTAMFHNPWAGTFAMRMEDVARAKLSDVWKRSVVDDGPIRRVLKPLGLKIHFQPSLIMVNREECTFDYVNTYVTRMLTWSKLYEKTFINTVIHSLFANVLLLAAFLLTFTATTAVMWLPALIALGAIVFKSITSAFGYTIVRAGVNQACRLRGEELDRLSVIETVRLSLLLPITIIVYGISCFRALVARQVKWREITYEVKSRSHVRMLQYTPMLAEPEQAPSKVSI